MAPAERDLNSPAAQPRSDRVDDEDAPLIQRTANGGDARERRTPSAASSEYDPDADLRRPEGLPEKDPFRTEVARCVRLSWPLVLQNLMMYALTVISIAFLGRLGAFQLSAAVLGTSLYNITGLSIMVGLSSGLETLCGQANGARQHHLLGIYLQRSLLIIFTISLPITIMWTQAERVLVFLGQEPALSRLAARYLLCMIPSLWLAAAGECLRRYLMAQSAVKAPMFIVAGNTALSPLVHYLFIFKMGWGLYGGAAAVLVANLGSAGMLAAYAICWPGSHRRAWPGFSADAFRGWGVYLRIAVPSTAMLVCEWWAFEFVLLAAGLLEDPDVALSAMGLCFQVTSLLYMVPLGLGGAISTRVSNELGAYRPQQARMAALVCAGLIVLSQGSMSVMVIALRQYVPRLFTSDQRVIDLAAKCLFPLGISVIGDGLQCVLSGLLRGSGRPALGAYISLATYWGAGLPFAWLFGFHFGMGAVGLWVGLACTTNLQGLVVSGVVALVMDWESEAKRAARLVREASVHSLGRLQADGKTLGQTLDAERGQHPAWRTSGASAGGGDSTSPTRRPLEV